jgi:hypothetical protein
MPNPVPIDLKQLAHFSIDENGRLYWDGKVVQTESVVVLSGKQSFWAVLIAIATIVSAISSSLYTGFYLSTLLRPKSDVHQMQPQAVVPKPSGLGH